MKWCRRWVPRRKCSGMCANPELLAAVTLGYSCPQARLLYHSLSGQDAMSCMKCNWAGHLEQTIFRERSQHKNYIKATEKKEWSRWVAWKTVTGVGLWSQREPSLNSGSVIYSWLILDKLFNFSKADSTSEEVIFRRLVPGGRRYQRKMYTQPLTLSEFPCSPQTQTEWWQGPREWYRQWWRQCMSSDDCPSDLLVIMLFRFSWNQL